MTIRHYLPVLVLGVSLLAGCATGPGGPIYVPSGQTPADAPPPPEADTSEQSERASEQPEPEQAPRPKPHHQAESESLSPAAASLVNKADALLANGDTRAAISQLERAQRISPRAGKVYFKLAEAYYSDNRLGAAEQFTLKGLSLAGSSTDLQRTGWSLLADIRRAGGNVAGAQKAEARAQAL